MSSRHSYIVFDLDSTLADTTHRQSMIEETEKKDRNSAFWTAYSMACSNDAPIEAAIKLTRLLSNNHKIAIITGRSILAKEKTVTWLSCHGAVWDSLMMRRDKDRTSNAQMKFLAIKAIQEYDPVELIVEDHYPVAKELERRLGIPVLRVRPYPDDTTSHENISLGK